ATWFGRTAITGNATSRRTRRTAALARVVTASIIARSLADPANLPVRGRFASPDFALGRQRRSTAQRVRLASLAPSGLVWLATRPSPQGPIGPGQPLSGEAAVVGGEARGQGRPVRDAGGAGRLHGCRRAAGGRGGRLPGIAVAVVLDEEGRREDVPRPRVVHQRGPVRLHMVALAVDEEDRAV